MAALLVGCEDDENIPPGGVAGSNNGGTAGTAGTNNGGTAGTTGGTAGTAGGAGGAGNGGTAGAGNGGTAGGGGSAGGTACGDATGDGTTGAATSVATGSDSTFVSPFDATPSPDGCTVYFTAVDAASGQGAVYSVGRDGMGLKRIDQGSALVAPVGIAVSTDGATLYIADAGYGASTDATKDTGAILSLSSAGGTPAKTVAGLSPRSITVVREGNTDQVYFGGTTDAGVPSIFKAAAGATTATAAGTTGGEVGGIASNDGAALYLASPDTQSVVSGTTTVASGVPFGLAGGVAVSRDGTAVLVATRNATGASGILRVVIAGGATTFKPIGTGLVEPSGLHRASNVEVYAFVDASGTNGAGSVWIAAK